MFLKTSSIVSIVRNGTTKIWAKILFSDPVSSNKNLWLRKAKKKKKKPNALTFPALASFNPSTPKSDQFQISPAAPPEILYHTVWRTWLFIAYSDERWLYYQLSLPTYTFLFKRLGECTFWTWEWKGWCQRSGYAGRPTLPLQAFINQKRI